MQHLSTKFPENPLQCNSIQFNPGMDPIFHLCMVYDRLALLSHILINRCIFRHRLSTASRYSLPFLPGRSPSFLFTLSFDAPQYPPHKVSRTEVHRWTKSRIFNAAVILLNMHNSTHRLNDVCHLTFSLRLWEHKFVM